MHQNGLTAYLYQILARISVWGNCWNSPRQRRDTGPEHHAGPAHICDREDTGGKKKKPQEGRKMLRVTYKLRSSSSSLLKHLQKMPQRRRGNCDRARIPKIMAKRARNVPLYYFRCDIWRLTLCDSGSQGLINIWSLREMG